MPNDAWCRVRETLAKRIGKNNYTSWIEPLQLTDLSDGIARFDVPTTFFGDWVSRNFSDHILSLMNAEGLPVGRAEFTVATQATAPNAAKPVRAPKTPARRNDDDLPGATLDSRPKAVRSLSIRCSFMAALALVKPT